MPLDPDFQKLLDALEASGVLTELSAGTPEQAREGYRTLALARRGGPDYVPEEVASVEDRAVLGPRGPIPVRIYHPIIDRGRSLTYLHGGGWVIGDIDTHDPIARMAANALGAVTVSVGYRLAPEHPFPEPLDDALAAAAWTADQWLERTHVVGGDSAGAALSIGVALRARDEGGPAIAALLLIYPPADPTMSMPSVRENGEGFFLTHEDMVWFMDRYAPDPATRSAPEIDLLHADLAGLSPTVVVTAEFDPLRDEGEALAARLVAAGVAVRHIPGPGLIHGYFGFSGTIPAAREASERALAALEELLGP